jgi:hypothetical protein
MSAVQLPKSAQTVSIVVFVPPRDTQQSIFIESSPVHLAKCQHKLPSLVLVPSKPHRVFMSNSFCFILTSNLTCHWDDLREVLNWDTSELGSRDQAHQCLNYSLSKSIIIDVFC